MLQARAAVLSRLSSDTGRQGAVILTVEGSAHRLDGDTFASWHVRHTGAAIAAATGRLYGEVVTDVITRYIAAPDGQRQRS